MDAAYIKKRDALLARIAQAEQVYVDGAKLYDRRDPRVQPKSDFLLGQDLMQGEAEAKAWGCDLTYDYVKINGDYRS